MRSKYQDVIIIPKPKGTQIRTRLKYVWFTASYAYRWNRRRQDSSAFC